MQHDARGSIVEIEVPRMRSAARLWGLILAHKDLSMSAFRVRAGRSSARGGYVHRDSCSICQISDGVVDVCYQKPLGIYIFFFFLLS